MRLRSNDVFYKRESQTKMPNSKHFIIFEGTKSELIYFEEFLRKNDVISNVFFLIRDKDKEGWSNPQKILDMLISVINGRENIHYTYDSIFEDFYKYISPFSNLFSKKVIRNKYLGLVNKYVGNIHSPVEIEHLMSVLTDLTKKYINSEDLSTIIDQKDYLEELIESSSTFDRDIDKISLVVDRDKKSFTEKQYDNVLEKSNEFSIDFYVINPCFEFWLLLHWSDCTKYCKNDLLDNNISETGNTFVYDELKKFDHTYTKSNFNAKYYIDNIDKAICNSKFYENDINLLKNKVGTNLMFLIQNLQKKKNSS